MTLKSILQCHIIHPLAGRSCDTRCPAASMHSYRDDGASGATRCSVQGHFDTTVCHSDGFFPVISSRPHSSIVTIYLCIFSLSFHFFFFFFHTKINQICWRQRRKDRIDFVRLELFPTGRKHTKEVTRRRQTSSRVGRCGRDEARRK